MDCSPQSSSVHGISQASILEWVAISYSRRTLEKNKLYHGTHRGAAACWPTNSWNLKHLSSWLLIWAYNRDSLFVFFFVLFMAFFFFLKTFHCFSFLLHWPKCSFGFFHKMLSFGQPQILLFWNGFKRQKILRTVQRTPVYPFCENSIQVSLMVSGMPFILEGPIQDHICVELSHLSRLLPSRVDASLFLNICRLGTL